jgi:hypothetical protein
MSFRDPLWSLEDATGLYIPVTGRLGAGATLLSRSFREAVAGIFYGVG